VNNTATLYLGVDNLFDENYETSYGMPQAGRFVYGGIEFRM
jgi:outer membrane receptor protein involved in Fe transport